MSNRKQAQPRPSVLAFGGALVTLLAAEGAGAQAVPNIGNYTSLTDNFRIGIQATSLTGVTTARSFQQSAIEDVTTYLDPSEIAATVGTQTANFGAINSVFDLRGATALASYAQGSPTLVIRFVNPDGNTVSLRNGTACNFSYTGQTRQGAFNTFDDLTDDEENPAIRDLFRCISRGFARNSPVDPLAGNPGSLQASMVRSALDLTNGDSLVEGGANTSGDPWIVGAAYTTGSAGRFSVGRTDGRIMRGFRLFEGNRALLKFDLPFSYAHANKITSYTAQVGLGLETALIEQRWSVEPRIAYGAVFSRQAGSAGTILQGSVTSRYLIQGIGRGRLVIGNMVGYGATLAPPATNANFNPDLRNWSFRNGLAYELPLKMRMSGRLTSLRASYGYTAFAGDKLRNNHFHEATLSFGLRGREESVRASRDLVRLNFNTTQARGYHSYTAGLGFRF
ncbi:hypothetical protein Q4F19_12475 [Sphingomonas sp. BIUV-7]|uniref:Autotransporter domain-containing protein n=1 Tax=Sphingomonas natans TaxID=3063330 RepID=A0ABT8YBV9_9SPHN|nr:hypothetical protein [Sphingomonas sp. BIUV-7]MDO6415199.1 hypothetical protein [Sphingomonas sp. BIUV-7]